MIKKIDIENLATFKNFKWDESLDKNVEFKKINILYGQNASGKTTLSRIFRALETGEISNKYDSAQFTLTCTDATTINQNELKEHQLTIRVFNQDFIRENLGFTINEEGDIAPFTILGKKNIGIEKKIQKHEDFLYGEKAKILRRFTSDNYDGNNLKKDIEEMPENYRPLKEQKIKKLYDSLNEGRKNKPFLPILSDSRYAKIMQDVKSLKMIDGNIELPVLEEVLQKCKDILTCIRTERKKANISKKIDVEDIYSQLTEEFKSLEEQWKSYVEKYEQNLISIRTQVLEYRKNPKKVSLNDSILSIDPEEATPSRMRNILESTDSLTKKYETSKDTLLSHFIYRISQSITYEQLSCQINSLANDKDKTESTDKGDIERQEKEIDNLRNQLSDEYQAAEKINHYLNYFFTDSSFKMVASRTRVQKQYKFEIERAQEPAFNLSEGERSLISFAYFIAKLEEKKNKKASEPIIWIDDPISSLDTNHIFSVYSLIHHKFSSSTGSIPFSQLFISTHNLEFLKYLKEVTSHRKVPCEHFMMVRNGKESKITPMPKYLEKYVTEFNFLFEQVYQASSLGNTSENYKTYYQFGNNARRFLECFLYFKYPKEERLLGKIQRFFGVGSEARLIHRMINEYSHSEGALERSLCPLEVPEMEKVADLILKRIKRTDPKQYEELCKSIGQKKEEKSSNSMSAFSFFFQEIYTIAFPNGETKEPCQVFHQLRRNAYDFLQTLLEVKYPDGKDLGESAKSFLKTQKDSFLYKCIFGDSSYEDFLKKTDESKLLPKLKEAAETILMRIRKNDEKQYNKLCESTEKEPRKKEVGITGESALV